MVDSFPYSPDSKWALWTTAILDLYFMFIHAAANLKSPAKQMIHSVDGHPSAADFTTVTSTVSAVRGPVEKEGEGYLD